jgi:hypothetical protein
MEAGEVGVFSHEPDGKIHHSYTHGDDEDELISSVRFHLAERLDKIGPHSSSSCAAACSQANFGAATF